jgi:hypothetical protein
MDVAFREIEKQVDTDVTPWLANFELLGNTDG